VPNPVDYYIPGYMNVSQLRLRNGKFYNNNNNNNNNNNRTGECFPAKAEK
jgi:hypothetical protein